MNYPFLFVTIIIVILSVSLYKDWFRPVIAFFLTAVVLFASGIIDAKDFLTGFANEQVWVVGLLLILSDIIQRVGILDMLLKNIISPRLSYRKLLATVMIPFAGISAFVNNSPLVAITTPYIYDWAKKKNISPSRVLMPVAFAIILGGTITLIGTSTNLVVNGFLTEAGYPPLKMFDFIYAGIPVTVIGIVFLFFVGTKLLPDRKDALSDFSGKSREYIVETMVSKNSSFIGKTIEQCGLRNLRGLFLVEAVRDDRSIAPVSPKEVIREGDLLIFAGDTNTVIDLIKSPTELVLPKYSSLLKRENAEIVEVVVTSGSALPGKNVKEAGFRAKYDAAIVAINRNGEKISGKLGDVKLLSGDVLLLITGKDFYSLSHEAGDFLIISNLKEFRNLQPFKIGALATGMLTAFILPAFGILTLFKTLLILLGVIVLFRIVKLSDMKRSLDLNLFAILALSFGIGKAISNSGADTIIADGMLSVLSAFDSKIMALAGIFIFTNALVWLVSNRAAVPIAFPVAIMLAQKTGADPACFALAVAFAGSSTFLTPYCYNVNMMIYGPGGYKYKDYVRIGAGLTVLYAAVCITALGYVYRLF